MNHLPEDMRRLAATATIVIILVILGAVYERNTQAIASRLRLPQSASRQSEKIILQPESTTDVATPESLQ